MSYLTKELGGITRRTALQRMDAVEGSPVMLTLLIYHYIIKKLQV